jgi:hypothetical protein
MYTHAVYSSYVSKHTSLYNYTVLAYNSSKHAALN